MTQADLIKKIKEDTGMTTDATLNVLNRLSKVATAELKNGGEVSFPGGLGKLVVVETKARTGRNPKTGAPVQIKAGRKAKFKAGKELTEALKA